MTPEEQVEADLRAADKMQATVGWSLLTPSIIEVAKMLAAERHHRELIAELSQISGVMSGLG